MAASGAHIKEFFDFVKAIGESKSKQEEDRIISDEVRNGQDRFLLIFGCLTDIISQYVFVSNRIYLSGFPFEEASRYYSAKQEEAQRVYSESNLY